MLGALAVHPLLLVVSLVLPLLAALVGVVAVYVLVRLGVRHGAADADRLQHEADLQGRTGAAGR